MIRGSDLHLLASMSRATAQMDTSAQRIASGKRIQTAADDPAAFLRAQSARLDISRMGTEMSVLGSTTDRITIREQALGQMSDVMIRANELTVLAGNPTVDVELLKEEMTVLQSQLAALANKADGTGQHYFAGNSGVKPFVENADGTYSYAGSNQDMQVQVNGQNYTLHPSGASLAGALNAMASISASLNAGVRPTAEQAEALSSGMNAIIMERTKAGAQGQRVENSLQMMEDSIGTAKGTLARIEETDYAEEIVKQKTAEAQYNMATAMLGKLLTRKSLIDII